MKPATPRQMEVLEAIKRLTAAKGYPPSRVEIGREVGGVTQRAVDHHVRKLTELGLLEVDKHQARSIRVREPDHIERIGLGEKRGPHSTVPSAYANEFTPRPDCFAEIRDTTTPGLGVEPGDLLALKRTNKARDGDIVIVELNATRVCRRLTRVEDTTMRLEAIPPEAAKPIVLDEAVLRIEGIVIGTMRFRTLER